MKMILAVALGGAIGAVGRHFVAHQVALLAGHGFPYGTLTVNVVGSFILGVLVEVMALVWSPAAELRALLMVGLLGAFTTFSTFSMEVVLLAERGQMGVAALYIGLSVALTVGGFVAGLTLMRAVLL